MASKILTWPPVVDDTDEEKQQYVVVEDKSKEEEIEKELEEDKLPDDDSVVTQEDVMEKESELREEKDKVNRRVRNYQEQMESEQRRAEFEKLMEEQRRKSKQRMKDMARLEREHTSAVAGAYMLYGDNANIDKINSDFAYAKDKVNPKVGGFGTELSMAIDNKLLSTEKNSSGRVMKKVSLKNGSVVMMDKELADVYEANQQKFIFRKNKVLENAGLSSKQDEKDQQEIDKLDAQVDSKQLDAPAPAEMDRELEKTDVNPAEIQNDFEKQKSDDEVSREKEEDLPVVEDIPKKEVEEYDATDGLVMGAVVGAGAAKGLETVKQKQDSPRFVFLSSKNKSEFQLNLERMEREYNKDARELYNRTREEELARWQMEVSHGKPVKKEKTPERQVRALPAVAVSYPYIMEQIVYNGRALPEMDFDAMMEYEMEKNGLGLNRSLSL